MLMGDARINRITETIIGCAFKVGNGLVYGHLEKAYENAMMHELSRAGLHAVQQFPTPVWYDGVIVGDYIADILVEGCVLVEIKSCRALDDAHAAQCINYLATTRLEVCLLINFGRRVTVKRFMSTPDRGVVQVSAPEAQ